MNNRHDQKEKPRGTHVGLCQRIAELEAAEVEREQTEEALSESERKYRDLVDNSIVGIYRTNSAGKILYVNEALARMLEFDSPEEMMAEGVLARYKNNKDREHLLEILKKSGRVDNFEFDLLTRKGETVTALLSAVLDQDIISGMIMDISERKRIEKALRESEQRYRSLFKNNHSVILLVDPESGDIVDANTAACSFYGWSLEELTSMKVTDINMLPNEQIFQEIERAKSEARNHFLFQHRLANEEIRDVEVYSGPISLHGKELLYSIIHDISERTRTEQELRESKNLFQKVFESQWDALFILDASDPARISDCNPAAIKVFGYNRQEMLGRTTNFLHVDESSLRKFQEQVYPAVTEQGFFHLPAFKMKRKDGTVFPTEHTVLGLEDEKGERLGWVSVVRDISEHEHAEKEKKKLEGQLLQTKKLEAISTLSGGVAQELSNLFQAVHGYVERLMWGKEQDDPRYQELLEITNAAFRGAVLSKRLLAFSGAIESKKHPIDLNQEIKKVHKLLMRTMPETIKLELHLANEITIINGDPNQIEQALLALAVNAREAMPSGGKIIIKTKKMILDDDFLRTHAGAAMGECALITVSDTGPGLGQKTLEHVFDPFYSKDDSSEKTGLGLSMVYGIVKNHGGYISCSSEPEVGTTFMIYLPVSKRDP
ncbi:MAG: PAS domain S-box protein [Deltaproteobacteria bacterium]|nr:PAS domain S-box protein [Deltaproteobacteria bacterium]